MAKVERNVEYLNASAQNFSATVQSALAQERAAYEVLKAAKAEVLRLVKAEAPMPQGREIIGTLYTRWGQWQVVVGDTLAAKAPASGTRQSLADFIAAQVAQGRRA